eukprot:11915126-Karenia_brevis.AAC.2
MVNMGISNRINKMNTLMIKVPCHETTRDNHRPSNPRAGTAVSEGASAQLFMVYGIPRRGGRHG